MPRSHWFWGSVLLAGALLAGCSSVPSGDSARARQKEAQDEQDSKRAAQAHAHYSLGFIHQMNGETTAAGEEFYQAAMLDPGNETLVLEASSHFLQYKKAEKALEILTRATARPGASGEVYARLGLVYSQLGRPEEAAAADRTAIKKSPDSLDGYRNLFVAYLQTKQPQLALKALDEAATRPVPDAEFYVNLSDLYMNLGLEAPTLKEATRQKALAVLRRGAKIEPTTPAVKLKLADGFNLVGDTTAASKIYLELLKKRPDLPGLSERLRANLSDIYLRSNDRTNAAEQLKAILQQDPTVSQAYYFLGRIALEDKKLEEAADDFKKLILLTPNFEAAYYLLAMAQINLGKPSDALATLDKARSQFPESFVLEFWTGMAYSRDKSYNEALRHFTSAEIFAKGTDPKLLDDGFYYQLGATYERKGDYEQAEKSFEKCLQLAPDSAEAQNYLGYMWAEHGMKLDRARELIEKAVKTEPNSAAYLDSLAWVLYKLKKPQEALPHALKAVQLSEEPDATVYDHLGDIYAALNQTEKAREAWKKSLSLEPNEEVKKKLGDGSEVKPAAKSE